MSYKFNSIVNRQEADALKQMIFQRIRERNQSMNEDAQSDVMDMARESFVSNNNPFTKIVNSDSNEQIEHAPAQEVVNSTTEISEASAIVEKEEIGFPQKELKNAQNKIINEQISTMTIHNTMEEAREGLSNKKSFMGALNFLNSQAAVSLIRTRADKFEVVV